VGLPPRWRKVARDLLAHKTRTALVVLSIAVGVFAILVVMGGRGILLGTFAANLPRSNPSTAQLSTAGFGRALVDRVAREPGFSGAEGRRVVTLRYRPGDETTTTAPPAEVVQLVRAKSIQISAAEWETSRISRVFPDAGVTWPPARGEIVLERSDKLIATLSVGSFVTVEGEDGTKHLLRVSGFAHDINAFPAMFTGRLLGYVSMQTMGDLGQPQQMNELLVTMPLSGLTRAEASRAVSDLRDNVVEPAGVRVYGMSVPEPGSHFLGDIFKALAILLLALGVMALFLSGFLVVNTVTALISQQVKQVGIMKAIGARSQQIVTMYLSTVTIYGALAILVGVPIGSAMASWFAAYGGSLLNFGDGPTAPPTYAVVLAVSVGLVVPLAAAWFPVRAGARTSVVAALNATGMSGHNFGHGLLDRLLGKIRGLPRPVALSLRNTFLRKGRLAITLATLVLASAVIMAVASVQTSIGQTVTDIGKWWNHDVEIYFGQPVPSQVAERNAAKVAGVTGTETWIVSPATLKRGDGTENTALQIIGLPPDTNYVTPALVSGTWIGEGEADDVVVNTDVVNDEGLAVGDHVTLNVAGVEHTFRVAGVVSGQLMGPVFFADRTELDRILSLGGGITELVVRTDSHTKADQDAAASRIEQHLKDAGLPVASIRTSTSVTSNIASELGILVTFLAIMAAILAAVGIIGLSGTMIINVLESTREIGVMRAIGASHASIYQVFVTEGVVVGLLSWLGGLAISWPMSWGLVKLLEQAIGLPLSYAFSWQGVGIWLVVVAGISAVASLMPAFRASQVSVRDAIAYE